jgi:hypothetical protein
MHGPRPNVVSQSGPWPFPNGLGLPVSRPFLVLDYALTSLLEHHEPERSSARAGLPLLSVADEYRRLLRPD